MLGSVSCMRWDDVYPLVNHTGKKSIDETTAAGDLDGPYVQQEAHEADRLVHHRGWDVEVPW